MRRLLLTLGVALGLGALAPTAHAWSTDPATNAPVVVVTGQQELGGTLADGSGGMFVVWSDKRSGDYDIFAQRLDGTGTALWPANGVVVASVTKDQRYPVLVPDGAGGIIVAWEDKRDSGGSKFDVYAQRLNGTGSAIWAANGVVVKGDTNTSKKPKIVTDGAGGAMVFWDEGGTSVYGQRLDANGALLWTATGVVVAETTGEQFSPVPVADGEGGVYVVFGDNRGATGDDLYAQHVQSNGAPSWAANGLPVVSVTGTQDTPEVVHDPSGGLVVFWRDARNSGTSGNDIYAQRLGTLGAPQWASGGVPVVTADADQTPFGVVVTGDEAFLIAWNDSRSGFARVYAQELDAAGAALWAANGLAATADAAFLQDGGAVINDAGAGAILAFADNRSGAKDIYLQHLSPLGSRIWMDLGAPVATAVNDQASAALVADGHGGAIAVFHDARSDAFGAENDLYAQNLSFSGRLGTVLAAGVVLAAGQGGGPLVVTYAADGTKLGQFFAFDTKFRGGVNVLAVDLNGDGVSEIVAAPLTNGREFRVFTPSGTKLASVRLLDKNFKGGFTLSSGDLDNDGIADLVVAPATAGEPRVYALHFKGGGFSRISSFLAYAKSMRNGIDTAVGDLDGDGKNEIVALARGPARAHVRSFRANGALYKQFFAYEKTYRGGGTLAVADANGDGAGDIFLAPRGPARSQVRAFTAGGTLIRKYAVLGETKFGTTVGLGDVTGDGLADVSVGFTTSGSSALEVANLAGTFGAPFTAYATPTKQAVQAVGDVTGDGLAEIVTVPAKGTGVNLKVFSGSGTLFWTKSPFASGFKGSATVSTLVYQPS